MSEHSPLPWESHELASGEGVILHVHSRRIIAKSIEHRDAEFIVRAVNAHGELLAASKALFSDATSLCDAYPANGSHLSDRIVSIHKAHLAILDCIVSIHKAHLAILNAE